MAAYVPDRGDVVWLNFDPQAGHEQGGRRPAIIVSPRSYNKASGLGLFCPATNRVTGYPFEVALPADAPAKGDALVDQVRNLDWIARKVEFLGEVAQDTLVEILENCDRWWRSRKLNRPQRSQPD